MKKILLILTLSLFLVSCVSTPPAEEIREESGETEKTEPVMDTQEPPRIEKPVQEAEEDKQEEKEITYNHEEKQTGLVFSTISAVMFKDRDDVYYDFYSEYNPLNYLLGWKGNDLTYFMHEENTRKLEKDSVLDLLIYASGFNYTEITLTNEKEESILICPLLLQENIWNEIRIPASDFRGADEFKPGRYRVSVTVPFNANYRMGHALDEADKGLLSFDLKIDKKTEESLTGNTPLIDLPDRDFIIHEMATGEQELILPASTEAVNFNLDITDEQGIAGTKYTISTMPRNEEGFLKINIRNMHNNRPVYWRTNQSPVKALKIENENKYVYSLSNIDTWMVWDENTDTRLELLYRYPENEILNFIIETKPFQENQ